MGCQIFAPLLYQFRFGWFCCFSHLIVGEQTFYVLIERNFQIKAYKLKFTFYQVGEIKRFYATVLGAKMNVSVFEIFRTLVLMVNILGKHGSTFLSIFREFRLHCVSLNCEEKGLKLFCTDAAVLDSTTSELDK